MAGEAQLPGREMSEAEFRHIRHRYLIAGSLAEGKRVLDVGCGAGLGLSYLAQNAAHVTGTDLFEENIALASSQNSDKVQTLVMDAHSLQFAENSFDVVLAMEIVQYLRVEEFLGEVRRVLVPGGTLFICLPNCNRPDFVPGRGTLGYYSAGELRSLLSACGFEPSIKGAFAACSLAKTPAAGVRDRVIGFGIRVIDALSPILPARKIKNAVRRCIGYKPVRLKSVLEEQDLEAVADVTLDNLDGVERDESHVFLYAIARSTKCP